MPWVSEKPPAIIEKSTRSVIPSYHLSPEPQLRIPKWNYSTIYQVAEESWLIQSIVRVITQEVVRPGWRREPRFRRKCEECGAEFQETVEECPICGGKTRPPSQAQARLFDRLIQHPNPDHSFGDLIRSIVYHDVIADDWYVSILPAKFKDKDGNVVIRPAEIRVEDPRYWRPIADEYGRLGIDEYYCPICYTPDEYYTKPGNCPKCGLPLERTAYVQIVNGEITARSSENWMIHGSTGRVLPELHGRPKIIAVWDLIHTIKVMDEYNLDAYSEGKLGGILNFPGYSQEQIKALQAEIQADIKRREVQDVRGLLRTKKTIRTLMLGSEQPIQFIRAMPPLEDMQSLDFYMVYIQAVCAVFGVQPLAISFATKSVKSSSVAPYIRLEVQNRTIKEIQRDKEEMFNNFLLPRFGITDWLFKFNPIEQKDELREAQIRQIDANTLVTLRNAGFDAKFNEYGKLVIPTEPTLSQEEMPAKKRPKGKTPQKPKVSSASERVIAGTTVERWPHGTRGAPE
ncbi:MAG: hypothetical protein DRP01_00860 [Archaeoglobales archaeon]|nr:MAG: hypothetical protein DRP01_00860 [Archaeoglobales archaeon]